MVKGGPAPNAYALPPTVGAHRHDPTRLRGPVYTLRVRHGEERFGLGPGFYNLANKTRLGPSQAPAYTMGAKLPEISDHWAPAPSHYHPEKYLHQKQNPPKFTIAKRTKPFKPEYVPAPDTYKLPSTIGPWVPNNGAFTMGLKTKTPRRGGNPAPNRYGPVDPNSYKTSSAKFTMRKKTSLALDKTQKPAPNTYFPKIKDKLNMPKFSFRHRDVDGRIIYFTLDDIKQP